MCPSCPLLFPTGPCRAPTPLYSPFQVWERKGDGGGKREISSELMIPLKPTLLFCRFYWSLCGNRSKHPLRCFEGDIGSLTHSFQKVSLFYFDSYSSYEMLIRYLFLDFQHPTVVDNFRNSGQFSLVILMYISLWNPQTEAVATIGVTLLRQLSLFFWLHSSFFFSAADSSNRVFPLWSA